MPLTEVIDIRGSKEEGLDRSLLGLYGRDAIFLGHMSADPLSRC